MTPKTMSAPAAAPSVASDIAKQLASLAMRTLAAETRLEIGLERLADQPRRVGVLDEAGRGAIVPGMPMPTVARGPGGLFEIGDERSDGIERGGVVITRRVNAQARELATAVERDAFDLRAAEIDPDAHVP